MSTDNQQSKERPAIKTAVIIVAAGTGSRLGRAIPKAFVPLAGKPLYLHALRVFAGHPAVGQIVIVAPSNILDKVKEQAAPVSNGKPLSVVAGGAQRWESAKNGVDAVSSNIEWVMIHDSARPFVSRNVIDSLLACAPHFKAAFTATPEVDTLREFDGSVGAEGTIAGKTVDRSRIVRVGTPQLFHRSTLLHAFEHGLHMNPPPTDEIMLMEAIGEKAGIAWGDPLNFKITTEEDLDIAESIISIGKAVSLQNSV